jgi:hypothetical protein
MIAIDRFLIAIELFHVFRQPQPAEIKSNQRLINQDFN